MAHGRYYSMELHLNEYSGFSFEISLKRRVGKAPKEDFFVLQYLMSCYVLGW